MLSLLIEHLKCVRWHNLFDKGPVLRSISNTKLDLNVTRVLREHIDDLAVRAPTETKLRKINAQSDGLKWAYLTRVTDKTQVTRLMGISWRTVGEVVERVVAGKQDPDRLSGLRWVGVDEFSHRKGQRYITLVVDHEKRRVVWAAEGRDAATLRRFFDELGPERAAEIEGVTTDLAGWNLKAIEEHRAVFR